jgi:hypothetical protein
MVSPYCFSPLCVPSRADPSGLGHTTTIYSSVQGPPGVETPTLSETKIRYPQIQKLLYAVILTRRKLRHYFESHPVTVV